MDEIPFNKSDELDVKLQIRNRFGLYDEVTEVPSPVPGVTLRLRQCNWIRFLRYSLVYRLVQLNFML